MIHFARETLATFFDEALPLFEQHFRESEPVKGFPIQVDRIQYQAIEQAGALRVYTLRNQDFGLVGYATFIVHRHRQMDVPTAYQDALYIVPKARGIGPSFVKWCEDALRISDECRLIVHSAADNRFSSLMKRLGYSVTHTVYSKAFVNDPPEIA